MNDATVGCGKQVLNEHFFGFAILELLKQVGFCVHARTKVVEADAVTTWKLDATPTEFVIEAPPWKKVDENYKEDNHEDEADGEADDHASCVWGW